MPIKISAGLLPFRRMSAGSLEVLLAHYGGPLWARKDLGSWTVVKGEPHQDPNENFLVGRNPVPRANRLNSDQSGTQELSGTGTNPEEYSQETLLATAKREFTEETGIDISTIAEFIPLGEIKQRGGKIVHAWAFEDKVNKDITISLPKDISTFEMEWPPHSGQIQKFPEIDRAEFFPLELARQKINQAQVPFLERLSQYTQTVQS